MKAAVWLTAVLVTEVVGLFIHFAQAMAENCGNGIGRWECSEPLAALTAVAMIGVPLVAGWHLLLAPQKRGAQS